MSRAAKICSDPECPNLQPCPDHTPKAWAGSTRRKRLPRGWEKLRRQVLRRDPVCRGCHAAVSREVDHVLNGNDHSLRNLQGLCVECHREKTRQEARRAKKGRTLAVAVFSLVGLPASGKTMIRERLAEEFDVPTLTIDEADDWSGFIDQLERTDGVVVAESNIMPPRYRLLLGVIPHRIVEVVSSLEDRRQRLRDRGVKDLTNYLTPHPLAPQDVEAIGSDDYAQIRERFEGLVNEGSKPRPGSFNRMIRGGG